MKIYDLKNDLQMFKRFAQSTIGWGFHISNAKLFVLGQMIERSISMCSGWGGSDCEYTERLNQVCNLIEYAKQATANEKTIYLHTITDWIQECITEIEWREQQEEREREWNRQQMLDQANEVVNQAPPPDSMGDNFRS